MATKFRRQRVNAKLDQSTCRRLLPSVVWWLGANVSVEAATSIFHVGGLFMEMSGSSRMLIRIDQTVHSQIPEDCDVLHIHHCANLNSLMNYKLAK